MLQAKLAEAEKDTLGWLDQEILEDEGAMVHAREMGDWNRYYGMAGHKSAMVKVKLKLSASKPV